MLSQVELDCRTEAALVTLVRLLSGVDPSSVPGLARVDLSAAP